MDNKYKLPKTVYYQCFWLVKDMERLRRLEAARKCGVKDGELVFFVDDEEVIKNEDVLTQAKWKLDCIRKALRIIPIEYRQGTLDAIIYNVPFNDMAHENTWRKWRQIFFRELARNLMLI